MKTVPLLLSLALTLPLAAQTPSVSGATATDFGALANANTANDFDSINANTAINRALSVSARAGNTGRTHGATANCASSAALIGSGAMINESGLAVGVAATDSASCGTSNSNSTSTTPVRGSHGLRITFAAAANSTGTVSLDWRGNASTGASATVDVDVNGDNVIDFHGVAGTNAQPSFPVTAGANGVVIAVTTQGACDVTGIGHASYSTSLGVHFTGTVVPPTVTFTPFGASCTGTLSGQVVAVPRGQAVQLNVASAPANALGLVMFGAVLTTPQNLPGSTCQLLVDRHPGGFLRIDAGGAGSQHVRLPGRPPVDVNFQVVTLDFSTPTVAIGSTNGLNVHVQ